MICEACGSADFRSLVHYGSYLILCRNCRWGPATSFIAIKPRLQEPLRATVVDEDWHEREFVAEGVGLSFIQAVEAAANGGKYVLLEPVVRRRLPGNASDAAETASDG